MIQNAPPNNVGRPKEPINPDDIIGKYSREALIEAARIRQENRDLPFEERKRRAELRNVQSRPEPEAKPEPVAEIMPTLDELMAQVEARKISDSIKEAELVNTAFDAVMAALKPQVKPEPEPAQLLPAPDALLSDYGPVGTDDITGDLLLDAFEENEAETAAIVQTLSALRLKHLSEQLNVERARLDREHQATGVANPRSASIDRLLGLLTRRGEV